jgi:hypothetical protein
MKSSLKKKWLKALRGGKYRQAQMQLRDGGAYCCLGVLCRVAGIPISKNGQECSRGRSYGPIDDILGRELVGQCMKRNDSGWSFRRIAAWLERKSF